MEKKGYFHTKAGQLTLAFIVIMIAFVLVMIGLSAGTEILSTVGFVLILLAMIWSPCRVYLFRKK